ncbi:unnamed protein product [Rodentolepis nana]|uniref:DUF1682 domain-containing protein n=1 Tax=Rodentolepis nana TaxID=102285 RepID=A0A0R3TC20_RODNA|nr:unnamed protein product [Rodentolepis nana]
MPQHHCGSMHMAMVNALAYHCCCQNNQKLARKAGWPVPTLVDESVTVANPCGRPREPSDGSFVLLADRDQAHLPNVSTCGSSPSKQDFRRNDQIVLTDDILNAGGGNREKVAEAQKQARVISGKEFAERKAREKAAREKQLEAEAKRKANAQQKAQKVERRRH